MLAKKDTLNGVLLLNKAAGITSHDAVARVRKLIKQRRVGHTGTLDPLATGLLVLCIGSGTKIARFVSEMDKTYRAEIRLGMTSETYDAEGVDAAQPELEVPELDVNQLETLLAEYTGVIKQKVPAYSAVRVDGERLYKLARSGKAAETPEREIEIKEIVLKDFCPPYLRLEVTCSSGTYIRSLAHDIGTKLGCGGYLSSLVRTRIGRMNLSDALTLEQVEELTAGDSLGEHILGYDEVLDYGALRISDEFKEFVLTGRQPRAADILKAEGIFRQGDNIFLKDNHGSVLAVGTAGISSEDLAEMNGKSALFNYIRVLN